MLWFLAVSLKSQGFEIISVFPVIDTQRVDVKVVLNRFLFRT
jgi:hypothetical protein